MRVLITGGTGLLGWWLAKEFHDRGFEVHVTYHSKQPTSLEDVVWHRMDLEDPQGVTKVVSEVKPEIVVHSAAYTDVDGCELDRAKAYRTNYLGTRALAFASRSRGVEFFIYISTDYVFDGERGMYREVDVPNPVNFYGLSKLLGEVAVEGILGGRSCVVRVSGLYGYSPTGKRNFGINALEKLLRGEEVKAFRDQWLSPTYVRFLAEAFVRIVERRIPGILHVAGERVSRYEFALRLAEVLGVNKSLVKPVSMDEVKLVARRPRDSSLDTSKARSLGIELPPLDGCLKDFVAVYRELSRA